MSRGYHGTRVDDIVEAAGVSHGAFYRYFRNKDQLAYRLAADAMRAVSTTFLAIPDVAGDGPLARTALRRWLRTYNQAQASETAMIRVWWGQRSPAAMTPMSLMVCGPALRRSTT